MVELILADWPRPNPRWSMTALRYFNPVGAHESGLIGEDPQGVPNNLMPFIAQVAVGRRDKLRIFGNDYPTPDGTGVRDYIHVVDLADGHLAALEYGQGRVRPACLQPRHRHSATACWKCWPRSGAPAAASCPTSWRRAAPGDVASSWADPAHAERGARLARHAQPGPMCADTWRWQSSNPNGYET